MPSRKKPKGTVKCKLVVPEYDWPDPAMVPTTVLRRCERAETIEEVRAIVAQHLPTPRGRAR